MVWCAWAVICRREWNGRAYWRVDGLCAFECARQDCRPGSGSRHEPVGDQYCDLLCRIIARCTQLHHDASEHAHKGNVVDAYAAYVLGMVYHRGACFVVVPGSTGRRHSVATRSHCGHQLLYSWRSLRERCPVRYESKLPASHRRFADLLAAPVLVLWPSGSLHRDPARNGRDIAHPLDVCAQASFRLSSHGVCDLCDRHAGLLCLGPSHVHQRHEPLLGDRVFDSDAFDWRSFGGEDVQLARHTVGRDEFVYDANAVCHRVSFHCLLPAALPDWYWVKRSLDLPMHDTYFVPAHFHLVMGVASIFGMFAATLLLVPEDVWPFHE